MTTRLTKAVHRVSSDRDAGREIVVILGPGALIGFRLKGCRKIVETTVRACYEMAVKAEVARRKAQRKIVRKAIACGRTYK